MGFFESFYKRTEEKETIPKKNYYKSKHVKVDINRLFRYLLTWVVGMIISLFPDLTQLLIYEDREKIVESFFSNEDIFLVVTTLTISVLFEILYENRGGVARDVVIAIGIMLVVFSVHVFTLLQQTIEYDKFYKIGIIFSFLCICESICGYILVSVKGGGRKSE